MKKERIIELGISAELAEKVVGLYNEEIKEFIPKARFDEINGAKKQLETDLAERDGQLEQLKKFKGDNEALKAQITKLQTDNTDAKNTYEANLRQIRIDNAVNTALTNAKAKNAKVVMPLLSEFLEKAEIDDKGEIKGLSKEIERIAKDENSSFLFDAGERKPLSGLTPAGGTGDEGNNTGIGATMAQKYNSQFNFNDGKE